MTLASTQVMIACSVVGSELSQGAIVKRSPPASAPSKPHAMLICPASLERAPYLHALVASSWIAMPIAWAAAAVIMKYQSVTSDFQNGAGHGPPLYDENGRTGENLGRLSEVISTDLIAHSQNPESGGNGTPSARRTAE
jgi:hypothetical protein